LAGNQYSGYVGDDWHPGERLSFTFGLRGDVLRIDGSAPRNPAIESLFGRRTDEMPTSSVHISPRFGFSWDLGGASPQRVRGGVGVFTGRPLLAWVQPARLNYGIGIGRLQCGSGTADLGPPPMFRPDYRSPPTSCSGGGGVQKPPLGDVDLLAPNLRPPQALRGSLAYERRLPWNILSTTEVLVTRYMSDFLFVNLNLVGPQTVDRFGRVMYGTIGASGVAKAALKADSFPAVIELQNTSKNYSRQLTTRLERPFARGFAGMVSYTFSQMRDVASPSRVLQASIATWADARTVSGRHDELVPGVSLNDLPHRLTAAVTYGAPWHRGATAFAFYYVGESGTPFAYRAGGVRGLGDLNADGSNINDPIYVPRNSFDSTEIRFAALSDSVGADRSPTAQAERVRRQQSAFEEFINRTECLSRQRGRIVERNSCREPWSHTTIAALRQSFPVGARMIEAELDAFNVLNLLNAAWGQYHVADPRILEHVGQTSDSTATAQSVFRFASPRPQWTTLKTESAYQLQIALRYRF
jgi:hypothetical protein